MSFRSAAASITSELAVPASALAIGAHPDDIEFGCGATLARWSAAGCVAHLLICTDGSKGTWDPEADTADLVALRQREARAAAAALGATGEVVLLGEVDGELTSSMALRARVAAVIRRLRPAVLLGHDPWRRYRLHPDHRHAGWLCTEGLVAARDPHFFPEDGLGHHRPEHLLLFEADEANHVEPAGEEHLAAKLAALESHRSQLRSTMGVEEGTPEAPAQLAAWRDRQRAAMAEAGALTGAPLGEAFHRIEEV